MCVDIGWMDERTTQIKYLQGSQKKVGKPETCATPSSISSGHAGQTSEFLSLSLIHSIVSELEPELDRSVQDTRFLLPITRTQVRSTQVTVVLYG